VVEHLLGKEEVGSSILLNSSDKCVTLSGVEADKKLSIINIKISNKNIAKKHQTRHTK
jgi:hypothetical protein